jgi:methyl-accepting chemotaxis protein
MERRWSAGTASNAAGTHRDEEDEVNWTISRRIISGFAIGAVLVLIIALVGVWALRSTSGGYEDAVVAEREVLLSAVEARGGVRQANVAFLRYMVDGVQGAQLGDLEREMADARAELTELRDDARLGDAASWSEALRQLAEWEVAVREMLALWDAGDQTAALQLRSERAQPLRAQLEASIERGIENARSVTDGYAKEASNTAGNSERAILVGLMLALLVFIVTGYLLNNAVAAPLQDTSNVLASSAAEILATTTEQASGATESLAAVTQTAATVDQVVQTAEQSAERARVVAQSAQRAADISRDGRAAVDTTVESMTEVREQVDAIGERILQLADQAQAIGEIISTVTDLAEQTNLLALNAAIEAARAGEQGRGFAVVAGEIKSLAEQSKAGTSRVRQILEQIQRATSSAVTATEQGNRKAAEASKQVQEAGEKIRELSEAIGASSQAAAQIAASAGQQSTGMSQIRQAIGSIQQAAQQNLAATRQAEAAAQELNRVGSRLLHLVGATAGSGKS